MEKTYYNFILIKSHTKLRNMNNNHKTAGFQDVLIWLVVVVCRAAPAACAPHAQCTLAMTMCSVRCALYISIYIYVVTIDMIGAVQPHALCIRASRSLLMPPQSALQTNYCMCSALCALGAVQRTHKNEPLNKLRRGNGKMGYVFTRLKHI